MSRCLAAVAEITSLRCELASLLISRFEHSDSRGLRKSFVIQHDPNPLFDVLGYLLTLAIHDDVFAMELRDIEEVYQIEIPPHMKDVKLGVKETKLDLPIFHRLACPSNKSWAFTELRILGDYSEPNAGYPSPFVFTSGHGEHWSSQMTMPTEERGCNHSILFPLHQNGQQSVTHHFNFCCYAESSVFEHHYLQSATLIASSHVEGHQDVVSLECGAHDTRWHRCTEDRRVEHLYMLVSGRQLEDQVGQILELVQLWREEKEKTGQTSRDSKVKKRAAPPSEPRKSSQPKKLQQL